MENYIDVLRNIISELEETPSVEVFRDQITEGPGRDYIVNYMGNTGWNASDDYINFCSSLDFVDIEWEVKPSVIDTLSLETSMCTNGKINLFSLEYVLSEDFWLNPIWYEFNVVRGIHTNSRLILIDYFESDISGCVCLEAVDKVIGSELYYFDHQNGNYPLGVSFSEYFLRMQEFRGIYGWQKALLGNDTVYQKQVGAALNKIFNEKSSP